MFDQRRYPEKRRFEVRSFGLARRRLSLADRPVAGQSAEGEAPADLPLGSRDPGLEQPLPSDLPPQRWLAGRAAYALLL